MLDRRSPLVCFAGTCLTGLTLALLAGGLSGCEKDTPASSAVREAGTKSRVAGNTAFSAESLNKGVSGVITAVGPAAQGTDGEKSAGQIINARATLALGEQAATAMTEAEREIRERLAHLNQLSSLWSLKNSVAKAADGFDPSQALGTLQGELEAKQAELTRARARRDEVQTELGSLRERAGVLDGEAKALYAQASSLTQQAAAVSAREGVPLVENAAALRRQGDAKRMEGEKLTAQADVLQPQLSELETLIQQYQNQVQNVERAQERLRKGKQDSQRQASEARQEAQGYAGEIDATVREVFQIRDERFQRAFDDAIGQFGKTVTLARGAGNDAGAKLTAGSGHMSVAGLHATRMQLVSSMAGTMQLLAVTQPPLPNVSEYSTRRSALEDEGKAQFEAAKQALEAARGSFGGLQVSAPTREQLTALSASLAALPEALEAPPADGIPRSARRALETMLTAAREGRWEDMKASFQAETEEDKRIVDLTVKLSSSTARVASVVESKFSSPIKDVFAKNQMSSMMLQMFESENNPAKTDFSTVVFSKVGNDVHASVPGAQTPTVLVQTPAGWKVSLEDVRPMLAQVGPMLDKLTGVLDDFAGKVEAGEYSDAQAAADGFAQLMQGAMGAGMGGG